MTGTGRLWLASASPRRRELLASAGIDAVHQPPDIDDARLRPGSCPARDWVMAMAYLKGRRVADILADRREPEDGTVLAADTVCVHHGQILGQPRDADHAAAMLRAMRDDVHQTITGVCVIERAPGARCDQDFIRPDWLVHRWLWVDAATVIIGALSDAMINEYIASNQWRGKAGGYNLEERLSAGWPIHCEGDPTTVMGLPMRKLAAWLQSRVAA